MPAAAGPSDDVDDELVDEDTRRVRLWQPRFHRERWCWRDVEELYQPSDVAHCGAGPGADVIVPRYLVLSRVNHNCDYEQSFRQFRARSSNQS
jgi:hypothetical protein